VGLGRGDLLGRQWQCALAIEFAGMRGAAWRGWSGVVG
jgi:hypothetical protein